MNGPSNIVSCWSVACWAQESLGRLVQLNMDGTKQLDWQVDTVPLGPDEAASSVPPNPLVPFSLFCFLFFSLALFVVGWSVPSDCNNRTPRPAGRDWSLLSAAERSLKDLDAQLEPSISLIGLAFN